MALNSPASLPEELEKAPQAAQIPTISELIERYKDFPLAEARKLFREKYMTPAFQGTLMAYAKDSSLKYVLADDSEIPTATIDSKTGVVMIGKSLFLACLDPEIKGLYNRDLLLFLPGHEIGHYLDLYSSADKTSAFDRQLERYERWQTDLECRLQKKWRKDFGDFHGEAEAEPIENEGEEKRTNNPLYMLYHEFFNKLDDPLVNERAILGFKSLQRKSFNLSDMYEFSLFKSRAYKKAGELPEAGSEQAVEAPLCVQLGNYLLQKVMSPHLNLKVDEKVQAELDQKYNFNGGDYTLLQILQYLVDHHKIKYAAVRYTDHYEKYFIPAFERLMEEDKENYKKLQDHMEKLKEQIDQEGQPKEGEGQPKQGEGQPKQGEGQPKEGQGQPKQGEGQPKEGQGQPKQGEGQPKEGQGQPKQGEGQPKEGQGQPKEGEGQKGKGPGAYPNPFQKRRKETGEAKDKARKTGKETREENKAENAQKSKSDAEKAKDAISKAAAKMAGERNLDLDKTQRYFELVNEYTDEIETLGRTIIALLLRNKTEAITILETRKKTGGLVVKDLIKSYAGIMGGDAESKRVFERKITLEQLKQRTINLKLRLLIDNSGSMSNLLPDLEVAFVVVTNAFRFANELLQKEYGLQKVSLTTEMILFGNEGNADKIKHADSMEQSKDEFDADVIKAFSQITCNEGTCDDEAWEIVNNDFQEEEVTVEGDTESISIALEMTDGYSGTPEGLKNQKSLAKSNQVNVHCAMLENEQASDTSFFEATRSAREALDVAIKSGNREEMTRCEKDLREVSNTWREQNQAAYKALKNNPGQDIWEENEWTMLQGGKEVIPLVELLIMNAVNQVDEQLEGTARFLTNKHFVAHE